MRTGSLRGAPLAGLVSAYHAVHAGPCGVICVASARRKKLPTRKCGSAYRSSATCSPECCGADGTALNTCCIGPGGEDNINSGPCAATIESADQPCLHSIYNCSIKRHCWFEAARRLDQICLFVSCCFCLCLAFSRLGRAAWVEESVR